ncbi:endonuclease/exonuclease/phosphatase family protein [Actinoplanes sp. CA-131856]
MGDHRVPRQRSRTRLSLAVVLTLAAGTVAGITTQADASSLSFQLDPGDSLGPGDKIVSASGLYRLEMLEDGRLVEYGPGEEQLFSMPRGISGSVLAMQRDGNLVLRAPGNIPTWSSETDGNPGTVLQIQDDAGVMLYAPGHEFLKEILSPSSDSSVPTPRLEPEPPVEIRVMSYNVRGNHHLRFEPGGPSDYSDVIAMNNAGIVGLQEISEEEASTVVEKLGWATGCDDAAHCAWTSVNSHGEGTAILSRYPMRDAQTWTLPQTQKGDHDRLLTRAKVDVDGQTVYFYNTHLASKEGQDGQAQRIKEIIEQDRSAEPDTFRPVLTGDLNVKPWDAAARTLADGMTDAWADRNPDASEEAKCTISNDKVAGPAECGLTNKVRTIKHYVTGSQRELPVRRIDYVFFRPSTDYQVSDALVPDLDAQVLKKDGSKSTRKYWEVSDHLPIVATLKF